MEHSPADAFRLVPAAESPADLPTTGGNFSGSGLRRFCKNPSAVAAAVVLSLLLVFALLGPMLSPYDPSFRDGQYKNMLPKWSPLAFLGWDGCSTEYGSQGLYDRYSAIGAVKQVSTTGPGQYAPEHPRRTTTPSQLCRRCLAAISEKSRLCGRSRDPSAASAVCYVCADAVALHCRHPGWLL